MKKTIFFLLTILYTIVFAFYAFAAPTITTLKGNPNSQTAPPYTFTFRVSDPSGVTSIKVNGRELNPGGIDEYDIDWNTYYNGDFLITATNSAGETSSKTISITNLIQGAQQPARQETVQETTAQPPTTQAVQETRPQPTEAHTQPTRPPQTQPSQPETIRQTERETTIQPSPTETPEAEESNAEESLEQYEETEESVSETTVETETETIESESEPEPSTEAENPPDSYRIYPGGKKNMTMPIVIIIASACIIIYCLITIYLNRKRQMLYQQLLDVLQKRKKLKQRKNGMKEEDWN